MIKKLLTLLLMAGVLTGCQAEQKKMLGITGYNYTNRSIDGFSVNGQGGGNVLISEDHAGGGHLLHCSSSGSGVTREGICGVDLWGGRRSSNGKDLPSV